MRDRLAVDEVLLQAHVAPNGLKGGGFYG
jgi:hypothetical protein